MGKIGKFYTTQQVALLFNLTPQTIKSYIAKGELKASWIGNRWRLKEEDVVTFINSRKTN